MYKKRKKHIWRTYADSGFATAPLILILMVLLATMLVVMFNMRAVRLKILSVQDSLAAATLAGAIPSQEEFSKGNGVYIPRDEVDDSYNAFLTSLESNLALTRVEGTTDTFNGGTSNGTMKTIQIVDYRVYSVELNEESTRDIENALRNGAAIPTQYFDVTEYRYTPSAHGLGNAIAFEHKYEKAIRFNETTKLYESVIPTAETGVLRSPNNKDITSTSIYAEVKPQFSTSIRAMESVNINEPIQKVSGIIENYTTQVIFYKGTPNLSGVPAANTIVGNFYFKATSNTEVSIATDGTDVIFLPTSDGNPSYDNGIRKVAEIMRGMWDDADKDGDVNGFVPNYNHADDTANSTDRIASSKYGFNRTVSQIYTAIKKGVKTVTVNVDWKVKNQPDISGTPGAYTIVAYQNNGKAVQVQSIQTPGYITITTDATVDGKSFLAWSTTQTDDVTKYKSYLTTYRIPVTQANINSGGVLTLYSLYK